MRVYRLDFLKARLPHMSNATEFVCLKNNLRTLRVSAIEGVYAAWSEVITGVVVRATKILGF